MTLRRWLIVLFVLWPVTVSAQHPHNIPDFCLGSVDTVKVNETRTIAGTVTAPCLRVEGTLRLTSGFKLISDTVFGTSTAKLEGGTSAVPIDGEIIFRDGPLDAPSVDPDQYGRGLIWFGSVRLHGRVKTPFLRTTAEPRAGQTSLSLVSAPSGWSTGDRLVIPGTAQPSSNSALNANQWETPTVANVVGASVSLASPLAFDHTGVLPHVGNLTRSIVIRSANPLGTRAHVLFCHRADVDIRYVAFVDLGRTTTAPIEVGNQMGRYPLHMHHVFGPTTPQANGKQFTLIGNVIEGGSKWGITVHNTHYGLVQDNVVYHTGGAGIMTEDGSETGNVFEHNFVVAAMGPGGDAVAQLLGRESSGVWVRGPNNVVRNNVVANTQGPCYVVVNGSGASGLSPMARVPSGPGVDPAVSGTTVNIAKLPLAEWTGNECYSAMYGATFWDVMASCCSDTWEGPESLIQGLTIRRVAWYCSYPYATNRMVFDTLLCENDPVILSNPHEQPVGLYYGDYLTRHQTIRHSTIRGFRYGIYLPIKAGDTADGYGHTATPFVVEDSILQNHTNILRTLPYGVTGGGVNLPPSLVEIRNTLFQSLSGNVGPEPQLNVKMQYDPAHGPNVNAVVSQVVRLINFNRVAGDDRQVFYAQQAASFVTPQTGSIPGLIGASVAGRTNAQNWASEKTSVAGAVAPCETNAPGFLGFVCPLGAVPPPVQGVPTISTITLLSGPTTIGGQQVWKFQSIESPNWLAKWGTDTHRFNVTEVPGAGPLPVFLSLHSAGANGAHEPEEAIGTVPGIYVVPVDLGYLHGLTDPVTGQERFYSKWVGYTDAAGIYQPVTADRVVRYVQWVLKQSTWSADPARVYVQGGSMGGGGTMKLAWLYPTIFAAGISSTGWVDTNAWAPGLGDCTAGVRWKTATGPLCTEMLDNVHLAQTISTSVPPLFLTWSTNDTTVLPTKYPVLLSTMEATGKAYQAEWRTQDHFPFWLPGNPHLAHRVGQPPAAGTPFGDHPATSPTGARTNIGTVPPQPATITVNPAQRFQTIVGWETSVLASVEDFTFLTDAQIGTELDLVVDAGFSRVRLGIRSGTENPTASYNGRYEIVNDNADPNGLNLSAFHFGEQLDLQMKRVVMPMRQRVLARGLPFYINLNYVDMGVSAFEHYNNPAEYAEFMLAVFTHLRNTYGVVPNGIEVVLEPDNNATDWTGTRIGQAIVATAAKLQANGFAVPEFIAPSTTALGNAEPWVNEIVAVPGAQALLTEISYHRYNTAADLAALAARAVALGKRTSMLEWWTAGSDHNVLHEDLTIGRNSAWQQGIPVAGSNGCGFGAMLFLIPGPDPRRPELCPPTKLIRQYTKYVLPGAQRIGASSPDAVAFINADGKYVTVVKMAAAGSPSVAGLPAGVYGRFYATGSAFDVQLPDVTITAGQNVSATIPEAGVLTIFGKTGGGGPVPVDCVVSAWGPWAPIDAATEGRSRTIVTPAANGGAACPALSETRPIGQPTGPATLAFTGRLHDMVGDVNFQWKPNGRLDGMFTVTFPSPQTVTRMRLTGGGVWDTETGGWPLGISATAGSPLLNAANGTVNVTGASFAIYVDDGGGNSFVAGTTWTLTATLAGGGTIVGTVTIGSSPQPVDCVVSAWGPWTPINATTEQRTRTIVTPAANGGAACPALSETRPIVVPPTGTTMSASSAVTECRVVVPQAPAASLTPPDTTGGWGAQIQRLLGSSWVSFGSRDTTSPYTRTVLLQSGTHQLRSVWTKTGQPAVTTPIISVNCGG